MSMAGIDMPSPVPIDSAPDFNACTASAVASRAILARVMRARDDPFRFSRLSGGGDRVLVKEDAVDGASIPSKSEKRPASTEEQALFLTNCGASDVHRTFFSTEDGAETTLDARVCYALARRVPCDAHRPVA